ncbi:MAG: Asp-tRNA(Asn)/Glu-tRNA(Gln) amidotransferase subunit GatA [Bacillota bacterium]|nr:Asp-tRNA(Asn)/Glu-tRNA(Gln) amidotransferase subunit GatA [Bacillota bacterium]
MKIEEMSAASLREAVLNKELNCRDIIKAYFERIDKVESKVDAYLTLCREDAFKKADEIDEKIEKGIPVGLLAGIPIAVKDNICTDDIRTSCASKMLEDFIPPYDATVVKRLKEEDAIIIGKTNMDEFAMGSSTENSAFKKTRNPWDLSRVPGGSSGGSAAAVASLSAPLALGSDTGGSIRQPASFCGVIGLKPTYGLVSRFGLVAFSSSLDQIGPFSKTVEDSALLLQVIQGNDALDSTSFKGDIKTDYLSSIKDGVKGMKVALPTEFFQEGLNSEIREAVLNAAELLKEMGAEIYEVSIPITNEGLSAYYMISSSEASSNLARYDGIRYGYKTEDYENIDDLMKKSRTEGFGPEVIRRIMLGTFALSSGYYDAYYNRAQKLRKKMKEEFKKVFGEFDLILSPVTPDLPFKIGEHSEDPLSMYLGDIYTVNINLAGLPAMSMPIGISKNNLPIGLQIIGPEFGEDRIFKAAYALEKKINLDYLRRDI